MNTLLNARRWRLRSMHSRTRGFTLVEVMVALIIIAIGMLGIAKMQALALASTGASRYRALAAIEASSLASAIHANRIYWSNPGALPGTISITSLAGTGTATASNGTLKTALTAAQGSVCSQSATMTAQLSCYCTSGNSTTCASNIYVAMAANDLTDFAWTLGSLLPSATGTVVCNDAATPVDCTITIQWIENSVAANSNEASAASAANAAFQTVSYTLYVVP